MVEEFETDLVDAINESRFSGFAYRLKQAKYAPQRIDVLVDGEEYWGIEAKSIKLSSTNKIYFTQHFSKTDEGHQVENITEFLVRTNRYGALAVEFRRGAGKPRAAFLLPWKYVDGRFRSDEVGVSVEDVRENGLKLEREGSNYRFKDDETIMDVKGYGG